MSKTVLVFLVLVIGFMQFGCAPESKPLKLREKLEYQNPETGKVVNLMPVGKPSPLTSKLEEFYVLEDATLQIKKETNIISVTVKRKFDNKTDTVELEGFFSDKAKSATLDDKLAITKNTRSRLKAYASCVLPDDCSEMYVNFYYKINGEIRTKQFVILVPKTEVKKNPDNFDEIVTKYLKKEPKAKHDPSKKESVVTDPTPSPDQDPFDLTDDHGEEGAGDDQEGPFVGPKISDEISEQLEDNISEELKKYQDQEKTVLEIKKKLAKKNSIELNLKEGAISVGKSNKGGIIHSISRLDDAGTGFVRLTNDDYRYGSGFAIDFIKEISRYHIKSGGCASILVNDISKQNGGALKGHTSHQNGQDIDVAYLPYNTFQNVVIGSKLVKDFNYECNWKFWELLVSQRLPDGDPVVATIFVNPVIKKNVCLWAKKNNKLETGKEVLRRLNPEDKHTKHFHIRLQCSPEHKNCKKIADPPEKTGC